MNNLFLVIFIGFTIFEKNDGYFNDTIDFSRILSAFERHGRMDFNGRREKRGLISFDARNDNVEVRIKKKIIFFKHIITKIFLHKMFPKEFFRYIHSAIA